MGAIDAVFSQFAIGKRVTYDAPTWQTPKIASSVSHVFGKKDDVAMVEIFGGGGRITYSEMKWWADHMQVSGVNFLIPHSFNPRRLTTPTALRISTTAVSSRAGRSIAFGPIT